MEYGVRPIGGHSHFDLATEQTKIAEQMGFDAVFFGEHHSFPDYWPSPLLFLASLTRITNRVRLGTSVLVLPLYHPIRLAEDLAMLDHISEGRLIVGLGKGWSLEEFNAFKVPHDRRDEMFIEYVKLLIELWTSQQTTFHGVHYSVENYTLMPKPRQKPHPPIWLGGHSPSAVRRAARIGDGWVSEATETIESLARGRTIFQANLRAFPGGNPKTIATSRHIVLAATSKQAWEESESYFSRIYDHHYDRGNPMVRKARSGDLIEFVRDRHIVGDPRECAEGLQRLREAGINYLILKFSRNASLEGFKWQTRLFVDEVLPVV